MKFDVRKNSKLILSAFFVVVLGVVSGYLIYSKVLVGSTSNGTSMTVLGTNKDEAGVLDSKIKYDDAIGTLVEGGIGNEGTHHLERDGGPSKNVYLTSSVLDLQSYVGKKVQVWGQTMSSKKSGWLMDVAKIKISQ